jgi:hypothetical protein
MDANDPDTALRLAAFAHVRKLGIFPDALMSEHLTAGFTFEGERVPPVNPQCGIFKPSDLRPFSLPREGRVLRLMSWPHAAASAGLIFSANAAAGMFPIPEWGGLRWNRRTASRHETLSPRALSAGSGTRS